MPRVAVVALGATLMVALASGCGGGTDGDEASPGMTRWSGAGMSFEYPESWEEVDIANVDLEGLEFAVDGPPDSEGGRPRITAYRVDATYETIRGYGKGIATRRPFELNQGHAADDYPVEVPGADGGGWRVETRFQGKRKDGSADPARAIELLAKDGEYEYLLGIGGSEEALESFDVEAILDSFRIEE